MFADEAEVGLIRVLTLVWSSSHGWGLGVFVARIKGIVGGRRSLHTADWHPKFEETMSELRD